jgi:HlyD family secretion protein
LQINRIHARGIVGAAAAALIVIAYSLTPASTRNLYITAPVEKGVIAREIKASGTVEAVVTVDVSSQLSGRVVEVPVDFNDTVKAGQAIARLDPETYIARVHEAQASLNVAKADAQLKEAAILKAQAALENAKTGVKVEEAQLGVQNIKQEELERDYERFLNLSRSSSVPQREMTQARSLRDAGLATTRVLQEQISLKREAVRIAEADIAMADANLANAKSVVEQKQAALTQAQLDQERTEIRSPIDGIIIKRDVNPGQTVAVTLEAKTLFKIAHDLREMEVRGRIDEADVGQLKVGQTATFSVDAYPDRTFHGTVKQIRKAAETNQGVVTYTAIISAENPEQLLLPGMTAVARVTVSQTDATLKIPNQALRVTLNDNGRTEQVAKPSDNPPRKLIWVLNDDGSPAAVSITVGASDESSTQVLSGGLREGQKVIIGVASAKSGFGALGFRFGF